jgi:DNA modification methylase
MLFTDPPWGVSIGQDSNPRHRQRDGLANDDLPPEQFQAFLTGFVNAVAPYITGDVYCVLGASEWPRLDSTLRSCGFHWSATVIWVKDEFVLGRSKFHRRYEPVWYGWRERNKSSFRGRRDVDDVWQIPRPKRSEEHPTMKPVELPLRAIHNSSVTGDTVLDVFGGSGSTLIAAEQAERKACLMEIDPKYCDVIVRRWERFAGRKAERVTADERTPAAAAGVRRKGRK